jgi:hypothetical protein
MIGELDAELESQHVEQVNKMVANLEKDLEQLQRTKTKRVDGRFVPFQTPIQEQSFKINPLMCIFLSII